jgi:hypothetical protein
MKWFGVFLFTCLLTINSFSIVEAKIWAEKDFEDSRVFYTIDRWINPPDAGNGFYYITFVKHINKNTELKYWLKASMSAYDKFEDNFIIMIGTEKYILHQVENPTSIYTKNTVIHTIKGTENSNSVETLTKTVYYDIPTELMHKILSEQSIIVTVKSERTPFDWKFKDVFFDDVKKNN